MILLLTRFRGGLTYHLPNLGSVFTKYTFLIGVYGESRAHNKKQREEERVTPVVAVVTAESPALELPVIYMPIWFR